MIAAVSSDGDRFGGLRPPYKRDYHPLPEGFTFAHPGRPTPPDANAVAPPAIQASVSTDRKKTNAQIVYTRITPLDSHLVAGKAEGCVFVSRSQMMHTNTGPEKRSLVAGLEAVNLRLAEHVPDSQLQVRYNPLDEWRRLPELREWPLDGVLLGLDNEVNASQTLNVCVAGPCPVRNVFREDIVMPLDYCYLMLVAELRHKGKPDAHWHFQYVPCTSRTLAEPKERGQRMLARVPALTEEQRWHAVGGWRLGRVMDGKAVDKIDQKTLTLDVRIEWVGWRALRLEYPDSQIGGVPRKQGLLARVGAPLPINTCLTFHWPTAMPDKRDAPIEAPSKPPMNDWELGLKGGMTKNVHAIADEKRRGCSVLSKLPALVGVLSGMKPPRFKPRLPNVAEEDDEEEDDDFSDSNEYLKPDVPNSVPLPQPRFEPPQPLGPQLEPIPEVDEAPLPPIQNPLAHVVCMLAVWLELQSERKGVEFGALEKAPDPSSLYFSNPLPIVDDLADVDVANPPNESAFVRVCACATATALQFLKRLATASIYEEVREWLTDADSVDADISEPWWLAWVGRDLLLFYDAFRPLLDRLLRDLGDKCDDFQREVDDFQDAEEGEEEAGEEEDTPQPKKKKPRVSGAKAILFAPPSPVSSVDEDAREAVEQEAVAILAELAQQQRDTTALDAPNPTPADIQEWMRALKRRCLAWEMSNNDAIEKLKATREVGEKTLELIRLRVRLLAFLLRAGGNPAAKLFTDA
jgi:hypothetical protein